MLSAVENVFLFSAVKIFPVFVSAIKHIYVCTNQRSYFAGEKKTITDIYLLAETKPKIFLCLGKLKIHYFFTLICPK